MCPENLLMKCIFLLGYTSLAEPLAVWAQDAYNLSHVEKSNKGTHMRAQPS